jgi:signal transduction histidine kinase/ActR/RegA family two-component response regulator
MISLTRKFLLGVGAMTVAVSTLASVVAFFAFQRELERNQVRRLTDYVAERARNEDRRFSNLTDVQRAAADALVRRMNGLKPAEASRLFDEKFPLQPDGTRRSRPQAFDGLRTPEGDYVYGLGAFISDGRHVSDRDKAMWVAAADLTPHFGEAIHAGYDNFYFYTPDTRLVMFGPDRPDHLMFYRHDAPANLNLRTEQIVQMVLPANNPRSLTRCTTLQRLVQDTNGQRLATACATPVSVDGRFVGAFGSSIDLTGYFTQIARNTIMGGSNLIVTGDGHLISWPGVFSPHKFSEEQLARFERDHGIAALAARIRAQGKPFGVVDDNDRTHLVAYGLLTGPDWYFLVTYPRAAMAASAARSAAWILGLGLLAALAETLLVVYLARKTLAEPLRLLARAAETEGARADAAQGLAAIETRNDEIGLLARTLSAARARVDDVLASLEQRVHERTAQLEAANQEKSRFLANMSHELRTPLNGVVAVAELLAREQTEPRAKEQAELIASSGRLLERVLSDILDVSKIEAGQMRLELSEFDVETLTQRIAALHQASAQAKGLALKWSVHPKARGAWRGDPVRLTQIQSNLLSNAVKFTDQGEVELTVERAAGGLVFRVRDTGIGFDEETRSRLFQRFEQADASITRRFGGTGLGLAICRSLAELMGGRIDARSVPGKGASFSVTLPLERVGAPSARDIKPSSPPADAPSDRPLRILLAEDHPTNQRVVRMILEAAGHELAIAENGRSALELWQAHPFDVVLMDMQMPEMDGLTATSALRAMERSRGGRHTPVIMLTANALDEHVQAGRAAGADAHLAKPIRASALLETIQTVLPQGAQADPVEAA